MKGNAMSMSNPMHHCPRLRARRAQARQRRIDTLASLALALVIGIALGATLALSI
jgi:hypothetical protein